MLSKMIVVFPLVFPPGILNPRPSGFHPQSAVHLTSVITPCSSFSCPWPGWKRWKHGADDILCALLSSLRLILLLLTTLHFSINLIQ